MNVEEEHQRSVLVCEHYALEGKRQLVEDRVCFLRHGGIRSSGRE